MYNGVAPYLHVLKGRIRVRVPRIKGSRANAARLDSELHLLHGVRKVKANPMTGNVLVLFDSHHLCADVVLDWIRQRGWLPAVDWPDCSLAPRVERDLSSIIQTDRLARVVVNTLLETTLRRLVMRMIV